MPPRLSPGPVFVYESLTAARRWQNYALRSAFVVALLIGLGFLWAMFYVQGNLQAGASVSIDELAELGQYFYYVIATVQVTIVLLAAPAATAGAICIDRSRGTLSDLFTTDLSNREIVFGKLAARLLPVFGLVAASVPVLAITALLGGIIFEALVILTAVTLALAVLGCSLSLAISTRAAKINEVLMAVFTIWTLWIVGIYLWDDLSPGITGPPDWYWKLNPYVLVLSPYSSPTYLQPWDVGIAVGVMLGLSALGCGYSVRRLRGKKERAPSKRRFRIPNLRLPAVRLPSWAGPSLDANPVLWREWHKNRQSSRITRIVWGLFIGCTLLGTAWGVLLLMYASFDLGRGVLDGTAVMSLTFGLLLASLAAPTALAEERSRGSLDVLMTTPLSTASIVLGKWWGAFRIVPWLVIMPALAASVEAIMIYDDPATLKAPAVTFTAVTPTPYLPTAYDRIASVFFSVAIPLAQGAVVTSFGLLLATWFKRPGRAAAASVSSYVLFTFGWIIFVEIGVSLFLLRLMATPGFNNWQFERAVVMSVAALSPLMGYAAGSLENFGSYGPDGEALVTLTWMSLGLALWVMISAALGLLGLTLMIFNRCVGRASERPRKAPKPRAKMSARAEARRARKREMATARA